MRYYISDGTETDENGVPWVQNESPFTEHVLSIYQVLEEHSTGHHAAHVRQALDGAMIYFQTTGQTYTAQDLVEANKALDLY